MTEQGVPLCGVVAVPCPKLTQEPGRVGHSQFTHEGGDGPFGKLGQGTFRNVHGAISVMSSSAETTRVAPVFTALAFRSRLSSTVQK